MEATVEIALYPLRPDYKDYIKDFIKALRSHEGIQVEVNPTATHLYGDYDLIFDVLKTEMKRAIEKHQQSVFVLKIIGSNLQGSAKGL